MNKNVHDTKYLYLKGKESKSLEQDQWRFRIIKTEFRRGVKSIKHGTACGYLVQLQALAPLGQRDAVVVVLVARVQERRDAVLQRHQRRADREQLVPGHEPDTSQQVSSSGK